MDLNKVDWTLIPAPVDDGGAKHLPGAQLPSVELAATTGETVDLSALVGQMGEAKTRVHKEGSVQVDGELWSARSQKKRKKRGRRWLRSRRTLRVWTMGF